VLKARAMVSQQPPAFRVYGPAALWDYPTTTRFMHLLFDPGGAFAYQKTFGSPEDMECEPSCLRRCTGTRRVQAVAAHVFAICAAID